MRVTSACVRTKSSASSTSLTVAPADRDKHSNTAKSKLTEVEKACAQDIAAKDNWAQQMKVDSIAVFNGDAFGPPVEPEV